MALTFLSFLWSSSKGTKHSRKFVMTNKPTSFLLLGVLFFFFDCALIFCATNKQTLLALATSNSPRLN